SFYDISDIQIMATLLAATSIHVFHVNALQFFLCLSPAICSLFLLRPSGIPLMRKGFADIHGTMSNLTVEMIMLQAQKMCFPNPKKNPK
ncbi:hypothetical protein KI387_002341, partial [Taxus chinensis]